LFIVIGGLEHSGVFEDAAHLVANVITDPMSGILILGGLSAFISGIVDNIRGGHLLLVRVLGET